MTGLLAIVAEALRRCANFSVVADIAALVTGTSRERRHFDGCETNGFLLQEGQICVSAGLVAVQDFEAGRGAIAAAAVVESDIPLCEVETAQAEGAIARQIEGS